jgi:hypothetical protein
MSAAPATGKFDSADVTQVLDGAFNAFGDAMKAGVQAQEEIAKFWSNAINGGAGPLGDWQKRTKLMFDETVPAVQKQASEWLKLIEQNYRRSVDLMKKAMDGEQNGAVGNFREKTKKLWEESVACVKENSEAMAQANVKVLELWTEILRKNLEQGEAAFKAATASVAKAAVK